MPKRNLLWKALSPMWRRMRGLSTGLLLVGLLISALESTAVFFIYRWVQPDGDNSSVFSNTLTPSSEPLQSSWWDQVSQDSWWSLGMDASGFLLLFLFVHLLILAGHGLKVHLIRRLHLGLHSTWRQSLLKSYYQSRWSEISQQSPANTSHLLIDEIDRMSDGVFVLLRMLQNAVILVAAVLLLQTLWGFQTVLILIALFAIGAFLKHWSPDAKAMGDELRKRGEAFHARCLEQFQNFKQHAQSPTSSIQKLDGQGQKLDQQQQRLILSISHYRLLQKAVQITALVAFLWHQQQQAQIQLDNLLVWFYIYMRLQPLCTQCFSDLMLWQQSLCAFVHFQGRIETYEQARQSWGEASLPKPPVLEIANLSFAHEPAQPIFSELCFKFSPRGLYIVRGANGSGKTTLADLLMGYLKAEQGDVLISGRPLSRHRQKEWQQHVGYLPQQPSFPESILSEEADHPIIFPDLDKTQNGETPNKAATEIGQHSPLGRDSKQASHQDTCSGGELKKAALQHFLQRPKNIMILDEPSEHLDLTSRQRLKAWIEERRDQHLWIILSHDPIWDDSSHESLVLGHKAKKHRDH